MKSPLTRSCFAAIFLVAVVSNVRSLCPGHENACESVKIINHAEYRGINVKRSRFAAHCDSHLNGWYQFKHSDGTVLQIPVSEKANFRCHTHKKCGTEIPITLRHKETRNDLVVYGGCFNYIRCCLFETEVCSKKCKNDTIYYLSSPFGCPIAYCTDYVASCSVDQYRDPSSLECVDKFPQNLLKNPEISVDIDDGAAKIKITCSVFLDEIATSRRGTEAYEVHLIKDNHVILSRNISYTGIHVVKIIRSLEPSPENRVPFTLHCRVRSFYKQAGGIRSEWFGSNAFYAGLSVYPSSLEINEASPEPVKIYVRPTIPILCLQKDSGEACQLVVQIQNNRAMYLQRESSACKLTFTKDNWNETQSFTLKPLPSMIRMENSPLHVIVILQKLVAFGTSIFPLQWFSYTPKPITVNLKNSPGGHCLITNPHINISTFDKKWLDYYGTGDFLLAKSALNNLEVHIRLWTCKTVWTTKTCNCAVAIREGANVVSVGQCITPFLKATSFLQVVRNSKSSFTNGFRVFRKSNNVRVVLSSGGLVDIYRRARGIDVNLRLSPIYENNTKGLCGNNNDMPEDDFLGSDGIMHPEKDIRGHATFSETWRLSESESFFEKVGLNFQHLETEANNVLMFCECGNTRCPTEDRASSVVGPFFELGTRGYIRTAAVYPKHVSSSFCPNNCGTGSCEDSNCVCPTGFAGETCSVNLAQPPKLSNFNTGPLCDVNELPCTTLHVIGNVFYDHPSLACLIQIQGSSRIWKSKAKYQSITDLTCGIPNNIFRQNGTTYVPLTVKISVQKKVSNEELRYIVYNSTCYKCNEELNCFLKSGTCQIKGRCIRENKFIELKGHCKTCEPAYSTSKWKVTRKRKFCPTVTEPPNGSVKVFSFGSHLTANYSCTERGFVLGGERSRTCNLTNACNRDDVHWSGSPPSCIRYDPCNDFWLSAGLQNFHQYLACNFSTVMECRMAPRGLVQVLLRCDDKIVENNYEYTYKPNYKSKWALVKSTWYFYSIRTSNRSVKLSDCILDVSEPQKEKRRCSKPITSC